MPRRLATTSVTGLVVELEGKVGANALELPAHVVSTAYPTDSVISPDDINAFKRTNGGASGPIAPNFDGVLTEVEDGFGGGTDLPVDGGPYSDGLTVISASTGGAPYIGFVATAAPGGTGQLKLQGYIGSSWVDQATWDIDTGAVIELDVLDAIQQLMVVSVGSIDIPDNVMVVSAHQVAGTWEWIGRVGKTQAIFLGLDRDPTKALLGDGSIAQPPVAAADVTGLAAAVAALGYASFGSGAESPIAGAGAVQSFDVPSTTVFNSSIVAVFLGYGINYMIQLYHDSDPPDSPIFNGNDWPDGAGLETVTPSQLETWLNAMSIANPTQIGEVDVVGLNANDDPIRTQLGCTITFRDKRPLEQVANLNTGPAMTPGTFYRLRLDVTDGALGSGFGTPAEMWPGGVPSVTDDSAGVQSIPDGPAPVIYRDTALGEIWLNAGSTTDASWIGPVIA